MTHLLEKRVTAMSRILITNDDGIGAVGLFALTKALGKKNEVYVVAPDEQQSAKSMAITFLREAEVEKTELPGAVEAYILNGTPVDCVNWGIE